MKQNKIQSQFFQLLVVLFIFSGINAGLLWKTLDKLFTSYKSAMNGEKLTTLVGDLELLIYEENVFREDPELDQSAGGNRLAELRRKIKSNFNEVSEIVADVSSKSKLIKDIENEWQRAKSAHANGQVLILVNSFIKNEYVQNRKNGEGLGKFAQASLVFLGIYMFLFTGTLVILSQYFRGRVFSPLKQLSEDMNTFEVNEYKDFMMVHNDKTFNDDEIGSLERKFYGMAKRVAHTVEELKTIDQVKTDFLSLASHELRTPMTAVKGSLSLILSGNLDEIDSDTKNLLMISEKETDRLIRLINDILDLTKIEAHKMPLNKKWISVGETFDLVANNLKGLFDMTKVKVEILRPHTVDFEINVDTDRLQQILINFLSNAVKYSPKGGIVEMGFEPLRDSLKIFVQDHGSGINVADQPHIFEKFRSQDLGKSSVMKGTGLGLPICKALVEEHGGEIGLNSKLGEGSQFYFTLPEYREVPGGRSASTKDVA